MKRFDYGSGPDDVSGDAVAMMVEWEDGDYILHSDHLAATASLQATIDELTRERDGLRERVKKLEDDLTAEWERQAGESL